MIPTSVCILCGKKSKMIFINNLRDDDSRNVYRCEFCKHIQVKPLPTIEEDNMYYQENKMLRKLISEAELSNDELRLKYHIWGVKQAKKIKHILNLTPKEKILEIGSGYGSFVEVIHKEGGYIDGLELSEEKCQMLKERTGIQMKSYNILLDSDEAKNDEGKYDVVCMHHVLEHISDPQFFLKQAGKFLKTDGAMYIEVPNYDFYLAKESTSFNDFSYTRAHLSYFTVETLKHVMLKSGLTSIEIYGNQRYSLENALNWIRIGTPVKSHCQFDLPECLEFANSYYKQYLEKRLICDSLIAVGVKGKE